MSLQVLLVSMGFPMVLWAPSIGLDKGRREGLRREACVWLAPRAEEVLSEYIESDRYVP